LNECHTFLLTHSLVLEGAEIMENEQILDNSKNSNDEKTFTSKFSRESFEYFCAIIEFVFFRTVLLLIFIYELVKIAYNYFA
jgi:hypothetical protein